MPSAQRPNVVPAWPPVQLWESTSEVPSRLVEEDRVVDAEAEAGRRELGVGREEAAGRDDRAGRDRDERVARTGVLELPARHVGGVSPTLVSSTQSATASPLDSISFRRTSLGSLPTAHALAAPGVGRQADHELAGAVGAAAVRGRVRVGRPGVLVDRGCVAGGEQPRRVALAEAEVAHRVGDRGVVHLERDEAARGRRWSRRGSRTACRCCHRAGARRRRRSRRRCW